jgi:hypothetical protein
MMTFLDIITVYFAIVCTIIVLCFDLNIKEKSINYDLHVKILRCLMSSQEVFVRLRAILISVVPTAKLGEAAAVKHDRGRPTGAPTSAVSSARNGLRYPCG